MRGVGARGLRQVVNGDDDMRRKEGKGLMFAICVDPPYLFMPGMRDQSIHIIRTEYSVTTLDGRYSVLLDRTIPAQPGVSRRQDGMRR